MTDLPPSFINDIEALLFASEQPLTTKALRNLLRETIEATELDIRTAITTLQSRYADTSIELIEVANGYRLQTRLAHAEVVTKLFSERPQRYSRALLETLALIVYQQPITRGEISEVRGVSVSSNVIRTLEERGWVEVVGHKEVPGRPALFGTTPLLLDHLGVQSISDLPTLPEMKAISELPDNALASLMQNTAAEAAESDAALSNSSVENLNPEEHHNA